MNANVAPAIDVDTEEQVSKRLELMRRFTLAGFTDTSLFDGIPFDVMLFLIPDDDPDFSEIEIVAAADSARNGQDVFIRHIRVTELPV